MTATFDFDNATTSELFSTYRGILRSLRERGIIRTGNAPTGDYAEYLAAKFLGGHLADNSVKSYDVEALDGTRYQVKSRVVDGKGAGKRQLSPFRSWDFEHALIVLFDDDYRVERAAVIPVAVMQERSTHRAHVNGHVAFATDDLLDLGVDVTQDLRQVAGEPHAPTPTAHPPAADAPPAPKSRFHGGLRRACRAASWRDPRQAQGQHLRIA